MKSFLSLTAIASLITIVLFLVSLVNVMRYESLARFDRTLEMCQPNYRDWIDLIEFAQKNDGSVVFLDVDVLYMGEICDTNFLKRVPKSDAVSETAGFYLSPWLTWDGNAEILVGMPTSEITSFIWDNGTSLEFVRSKVTFNPQTKMTFYIETKQDRIDGPVNVTVEGADGAQVIYFTNPIISDRTGDALKCAAKEWSLFQRAMFCPFL